jgi:hypothetical protein
MFSLVRPEGALLRENIHERRPLELLAAGEADEVLLVVLASVPAHGRSLASA